MGASTALQVSLLNYHLSQIRTGGSVIGAMIALFVLAGKFCRPRRQMARAVSVISLVVVAWMLWRGVREYRVMVDDARDEIPEGRVRSMLEWIALSHVMTAVAVCVALFGGVYAARDQL